MIQLFNQDCMTAMKDMKDNEFELAICDPPYGIGFDGDKFADLHRKPQKTWKGSKPKGYKNKSWDKKRPPKEYFQELIRVSKNQIIWGGNYFADLLEPSGSWIVWNKKVKMPTFSDGELAWCSINNSVKIFDFLWAGYAKAEPCDRIHPTQKPISLYIWLLSNYAKKGWKILDTHLGSGSIAIACHDMKFDLTGYEIDEEYYEAALQRLQNHQKQLKLF